jgi:hypothetical protein
MCRQASREWCSTDPDANYPGNHPEAISTISWHDERARAGKQTEMRKEKERDIRLGDDGPDIRAVVPVHASTDAAAQLKLVTWLNDYADDDGSADEFRIRGHASPARIRDAIKQVDARLPERISRQFGENSELSGPNISDTGGDSCSTVEMPIAELAAAPECIAGGRVERHSHRAPLSRGRNGLE